MRILVMCEGNDEQSMMNLLLNSNKLVFNEDDLIGQRVYSAKTLNNSLIQTELKNYNEPVIIYRIGDTQKNDLKIPKEYKKIIDPTRIFKYCTKPELEILLIINEGKIKEFEKSNDKPSVFAKENIKYEGKHYSKNVKFINNYYSCDRVKMLINNIKEYKRIKKGSHAKDELFLADLLKK